VRAGQQAVVGSGVDVAAKLRPVNGPDVEGAPRPGRGAIGRIATDLRDEEIGDPPGERPGEQLGAARLDTLGRSPG
jgi:hypothetical protein